MFKEQLSETLVFPKRKGALKWAQYWTQMDTILASRQTLNGCNTCVMFATAICFRKYYFLNMFHWKGMLPQQRGSHLKLKLLKNVSAAHNCKRIYQHTNVSQMHMNVSAAHNCAHIVMCASVLNKTTLCHWFSNYTRREIYKTTIVRNVERETANKKCTKCRKKETEPKRGILSRESDL